MRVVLDLQKYHRMGSHCLTTCFVTLFRAAGIDMPEEMSLGLGSGLGFTYVRQKEGFMFGGRAGNLEYNLASALCCETESHKSEDKELAWQYNRRKLMEGIPQICDVDMAQLSYMVKRLKTGGSGFSGHKLLLMGFDDEKNEVYILDYLWNEMIAVKLEDFKNAASSSIKPLSPDNGSISFIIPREIVPLRQAVYSAIDVNVNQMKNPVGFGLGLKALKRFFKELHSWPSILEEDKLRHELNMAQMVFEKIGTGGGNFRRMYARFLKNCGNKLKSECLLEAADTYAALGKAWKALAQDLEKASRDNNVRNALVVEKDYPLGAQIYDMEVKGIEQLEKYLEGEIICY